MNEARLYRCRSAFRKAANSACRRCATETRAGGFVVDAGNIAEHIANRCRQLAVQLGARQDCDVRCNFPDRSFVLVSDNDDLVYGSGLFRLIGMFGGGGRGRP